MIWHFHKHIPVMNEPIWILFKWPLPDLCPPEGGAPRPGPHTRVSPGWCPSLALGGAVGSAASTKWHHYGAGPAGRYFQPQKGGISLAACQWSCLGRSRIGWSSLPDSSLCGLCKAMSRSVRALRPGLTPHESSIGLKIQGKILRIRQIPEVSTLCQAETSTRTNQGKEGTMQHVICRTVEAIAHWERQNSHPHG